MSVSIRMHLPFVHKLDSPMREIVFGTATALFLRVLGAFTQFAVNVFLARMLGAKGMGIYALSLIVCVISSAIARLGTDQALLRFIAIHADQQNWVKVKAVFTKGLTIASLVSLGVALGVFFLASWLSQGLFNEPTLILPLQIMALSIVPFSLLNLLAEALRAIRMVGKATLIQGVLIPVFTFALLFALFSFSVGVTSAVLAYVFSTVIVFFIAALLWKSALPQLRGTGLKGKFATKELLSVSFPMAWVSIMGIVLGLADSVILGFFHSAEEVGIYAAAQRMAMLAIFAVVAVNSIAAPKFAALYRAKDLVAIEHIAKQSNLLMLLLASPLLFVFFLFPNFVMGIFGEEFLRGWNVLVILTVGQLINVTTGSVGCLLLMTSHEKAMKRINLSAAASNIALSFVLIPRFGVTGAAFASSVSLILLNLLALLAVFRLLKISTVFFFPVTSRLK